jgi:hypothetical protein
MTTPIYFNNGKTCKLTNEQYNIVINMSSKENPFHQH